jgi:hypothetical protein
MATEKQLRANRENAKKSTGPKTAAGRARSSRNAFRHGLSLPLMLDSKAAAKADLIRQMLVSERTEAVQGLTAIEVAEAQLNLSRIRSVRGEMMAQFNFVTGDLTHLRRLAALDRYEARALARRSRALTQQFLCIPRAIFRAKRTQFPFHPYPPGVEFH